MGGVTWGGSGWKAGDIRLARRSSEMWLASHGLPIHLQGALNYGQFLAFMEQKERVWLLLSYPSWFSGGLDPQARNVNSYRTIEFASVRLFKPLIRAVNYLNPDNLKTHFRPKPPRLCACTLGNRPRL